VGYRFCKKEVRASFAGSTVFKGSSVAQADGAASVSFAGKTTAKVAATSNGISNVSFAGVIRAKALFQADGNASVAFAGSKRVNVVANADGTSNVQFVGNRIVNAVAHCDGVGSANFTGQAVFPSVGYAQMDGIASTDIYGYAKIFNPYILTHGSYPKLDDYIYVDTWQPIANGVDQNIGVKIRVERGDVALTYTPTFQDNPDDFPSNVYASGDIFTTTGNNYLWIKPVNNPVSAKGEILYGVPTQ
jgi:hypothetical protein